MKRLRVVDQRFEGESKIRSQAHKRWLVISLSVCVSFGAGCDRDKGAGIDEADVTPLVERDQPKTDSAVGGPLEKTDPKPTDSTYASNEMRMVYLDQGWSDATRERFYHRPQGSQLIPYAWFLALEQADSEELFKSDANMEKLGFISQSVSEHNPDGLAIGFAKDVNALSLRTFEAKQTSLGPDYKIEDYPRTNIWLGLTCAACHTSDIQYEGVVIRIDGGPASADVETFENQLLAALRKTSSDDDKFAKFSRRVENELENNDEDGGEIEKDALRASLRVYMGTLEKLIAENKGEYPYGFARLDAFGAILNKVLGATLEIQENYQPANAPVSFPFLWDTPHLDWVQWNGSAGNPITRNAGEVIGVFAHLNLTAAPSERFKSTADLDGLAQLEEFVATLSAPEWPQEFLGSIDAEKAELGKGLYAENCRACHGVRDADGKFPMTQPNELGRQFIETKMVTAFPDDKDEIGTDASMVFNFLMRPATTMNPRNTISGVPGAAAKVLGGYVKSVIERALLNRPNKDLLELELSGYREQGKTPPNLAGYKARPLNGIWATAPYLHNGSVPNLYELLLPAKERVKQFYVGSRKFDPVKVGFETQEYPGGFDFRVFDSDGNPIPGNSNSGHEGDLYTGMKDADGEYRDFTEDERWAIVEYMKTLI